MASKIFEPLEQFAYWLKHGRFKIDRIEVKNGRVTRIEMEIAPGIFKSWTLEDVQQGKVELVN